MSEVSRESSTDPDSETDTEDMEEKTEHLENNNAITSNTGVNNNEEASRKKPRIESPIELAPGTIVDLSKVPGEREVLSNIILHDLPPCSDLIEEDIPRKESEAPPIYSGPVGSSCGPVQHVQVAEDGHQVDDPEDGGDKEDVQGKESEAQPIGKGS